MWSFDFIFLTRKFNLDVSTFQAHISRIIASPFRTTLFLFPEGTVITPDTHSKCVTYAAKNEIEFKSKHVLLPKSTGMYTLLHGLKNKVQGVWDITVMYSGVTDKCPYDTYPISQVLFDQVVFGKLNAY